MKDYRNSVMSTVLALPMIWISESPDKFEVTERSEEKSLSLKVSEILRITLSFKIVDHIVDRSNHYITCTPKSACIVLIVVYNTIVT